MRDLTNYTKLQLANTSKQIQNTSLIMLSNCNIDSSKNINSTLYLDISNSQLTIYINGNYSGFTGYIIIENEILKVTNSTYDTIKTTMTVQRAKLNTIASSHSVNEVVRDGQRISEATYWEYENISEASQADLFSPVLSKGIVNIMGDTKSYDRQSSTKLFDIRKNKYVYIFNGIENQIICDFVGTISRAYVQGDSEYVIEFKDKLSQFWDKPMDLNINFSQVTIPYVLSQIFNIPESSIIYTNGTDSTNYFLVEEVSTNEFSTYSSFLQALCKSNLFRFVFDETNKIRILSDVKTSNIVSSTNITSANFTDLSGSSDDNKVIINKINCDYKLRRTLYNRNDFLNGETLKYVNFKYNTSVYLSLIDSREFKANLVYIGDNVEYITISNKYYLLLVDNLNGNEFYCVATDIQTNGYITIVGGFDSDKNLLQFGKIDNLISGGYTNLRNFTLYYAATELPNIFAMNIDNEKDYDLRIPLAPQEEKTYSCKFGIPTLENKEYAEMIKEIDEIYGVFTNSQLKYLRRYTQGDNGVPLYLQTNKITINGSGDSQYYLASSFDNSDIQLTIEKSTNNEDDFTLKIKNTMTGTSSLLTPISTLYNTLGVSNINSYNTGDVIKLNSSNSSVSTRQELYYKLKNETWIIKNKFISKDGYHYIVLDKNFPTGTDNSQYPFDKYSYDKVVLFNEFYIKGNPVLQDNNSIESSDTESIDEYEEQNYVLEGQFLNIANIEMAVDYLKNGFKGTSNESKKRFIEFTTPSRFDIQVLDVITFTDKIRLNIISDKFIILSKSVLCSGTTDVKYKAISLNDYVVTGESLDLQSKINYLPTTLPSYNHQGNSGLSTEVLLNLDNKIISLQSKIGLVTALQINKNNYTAIVSNNINDGVLTLDIANITGQLNTYNIMLLYLEKQCIVKINNEYLLVKGTSIVTNWTTSTTLQVLQRDLFSQGKTEIRIGQEIEFYQILQIANDDGMYVTNTVIGDKANGKYFEFKDGQITIKVDGGYIGSSTTYFDITNQKLKINSNNTSNIFQIGNDTGQRLSYNGTDLDIWGKIKIGGDLGRIDFVDSGLILDDTYGVRGVDLTYSGFTVGKYGNLPSVFDSIYKNMLAITEVRNVGVDTPFSTVLQLNIENADSTISTSVFGNGITYGALYNALGSSSGALIEYNPFTIHGCQIPDNRLISSLSGGNALLKNGILSFHENELWVYKGTTWVQLT